jgi:hypothetical protein
VLYDASNSLSRIGEKLSPHELADGGTGSGVTVAAAQVLSFTCFTGTNVHILTHEELQASMTSGTRIHFTSLLAPTCLSSYSGR